MLPTRLGGKFSPDFPAKTKPFPPFSWRSGAPGACRLPGRPMHVGVFVKGRDRFGGRLKLKGGSLGLPFSKGEKGILCN